MPLSGELKRIGAESYLAGDDYHDIIGEFISELCLYYENEKYNIAEEHRKLFSNKGIESQNENFKYGDIREFFAQEEPYGFLQEVIRILTNDHEFEFLSIKKDPNLTGFEFLVFMNDAHALEENGLNESEKYSLKKELGVPIQNLSQGTISALSIFGLIHRYLKSLHPKTMGKEINAQSGIVFIDEIDAHLHPSIQLRIVTQLAKRFPNVQFFLTAHSPSVILNHGKEASVFSIVQGEIKSGYILKKNTTK